MFGPVGRELRSDLSLVARDWVVERDVRDDSRDILHVREINKTSRMEAKDESLKRQSNSFRKVWQRVWPTSNATEGAENWWEQWESWPLDLRPVDKE